VPLTVITGRANAGKTGLLYRVARSAVAEGRRPTVLLPSYPDVRRAAEEFALRGPGLGVGVSTFDDYLDSLWGLHGDGRQIVGNTQRRVLLTKAIAQTNLGSLERSAARRGFVRLLESVVAALGEYDSHARTTLEGVAGSLDALIGTYSRLLRDESLVERSAAARALGQEADPPWFPGPVIVNRFTDLTPSQERFLTAADSSADVWLALPWEAGFAATRALDGLMGRLIEGGAHVQRAEHNRYTPSDELAHLESHLFQSLEISGDAHRNGDVRLSQAVGEEAECDRIAAEVLEALAEGTPPSRIAVVFYDPARHAKVLRRAFAAAGISADYDVLERASQTGWGRALVHLLSFGVSGRRSDLLAFIRTPYSGVSQLSAERAEAHWRRRRVVSDADLVADLGRLGGDAPGLIRRARRLAAAPVDASALMGWQNLATYLMRQGRASATADLGSDAASYRVFARVLTEMASLPEGAFVARDLLEAFEGERVAFVAEDSDERVQVMSAQRARSRRFEVVVVGGLTAGDFPPRQAEDALSSAETCSALRAMGMELRRAAGQDAQRLLFYLVVSRATRRLVLSRQFADSDGNELRTSWLLEELLDLYRTPGSEGRLANALPLRTLGLEDVGLGPGAPATARRALRQRASSPAADAVPRNGARQQEAARRASIRRGDLVDERVLAGLRQRDVFSVTELEVYLKCPYAWFYERVIHARPLGDEVDALLSGQLIHSALERFYRGLPEQVGDARVTPSNRATASKLATEAVEEVLASQRESETLIEQAAFAAVREKVRGFVEAEARFMPGYAPVEIEFMFDTAKLPPAIPGDFHLRGRIDRIDRGPEGQLVVVDYKTGRVDSAFARANFAKRGRVQLPLYAAVAEQMIGGKVVAGLYRGVSGRNVRDKMNRGFYDHEHLDSPGLVSTDRSTGAEIEEIKNAAFALAADAVRGMRAAEIPAHPLDKLACRYCTASRFCGGVCE
jgi:RecB family exonuclease